MRKWPPNPYHGEDYPPSADFYTPLVRSSQRYAVTAPYDSYSHSSMYGGNVGTVRMRDPAVAPLVTYSAWYGELPMDVQPLLTKPHPLEQRGIALSPKALTNRLQLKQLLEGE